MCVFMCLCETGISGKGYLIPKRTDSPKASAGFHFLYLLTPASCCRRKWPHSTPHKWNWRQYLHRHAKIVCKKSAYRYIMNECDGGDKRRRSGRRRGLKGEVWCPSVISCFTERAGELRGWNCTHMHIRAHRYRKGRDLVWNSFPKLNSENVWSSCKYTHQHPFSPFKS